MKKAALVSNGDYRDAAGVKSWPMQEETLNAVDAAFKKLGVDTFRAHPFKKDKEHGFITTQTEGCAMFAALDPDVPVVLALSCWAYAHHVASSLKLHRGPILVLANFDGTWPGLVALLNHSATLERMNILHSRIWTDKFADDAAFMNNLKTWANTGAVNYSTDHITNLKQLKLSDDAQALGHEIAADILKNKRILGQLDPGCMGMLNAVLSPGKLAAIGMPVEYLNQSDLLAEMQLVPDETAKRNLQWLKDRGVTFHYGTDGATELVEAQVIEQMKMYTAAGTLYKRYGLSAIGIPYQLGLVRCTPSSDLAEGMLNNADRPDIVWAETGEIINRGKPINHFNEGDIGSGVPQVLMYEVLNRKGMPPESTLHDVRWGDTWEGRFVWVFEISGAVPPAHFGGWDKTHVFRQHQMHFPMGGGTCSGISKPGTITWARFYQDYSGGIWLDCGTGEVVSLPEEEHKRRMECTTKEWPVAMVHIPGYGRDELMGSHKSNHITICYGDIMQELAAVASGISINVNIVGDARNAMK